MNFFENTKELKSLFKFCEESKVKTAVVTTIHLQGTKTVKGVKILFIPASAYAYTVGKNTLENMKNIWLS